MSTAVVLILLSSLVLAGYLLELLAKAIRFPVVLLLVSLGILLKLAATYFQVATIDFMRIIPALGTIGLILIVFEGGLELEYKSDKRTIVRNAFFLSILILVLTTVGVALVFQYFTAASFYVCLVNAIPYSVISSAIAVPSAKSLSEESRGFITFESSLSDIFGIVFFNYAVQYPVLSFAVGLSLIGELTFVTVLSVVFCLLLVYLLKNITHPVKFVMIIAFMILLFAIGKYLHLSSLILVLIFGLLIRNVESVRHPWLSQKLAWPSFSHDFHLLHSITAEGVFLVKTFFFVLFGFIIDLPLLTDPAMLEIGLLVLVVIYLARGIALPFFIKRLLPELLYTPRGLITVLLYLSLPAEMKLPQLHAGLLFFIVLATSLVMVSSVFVKQKQ